MAKIEGTPPLPGKTPIPPQTTIWLGRVVTWVAKALFDVSIQDVLKAKLLKPVSTQDDFQHNYAFVLGITSKDLSKLSTCEGRLVVDIENPNPDKAKQLIKQTVRQARGRLIGGKHGPHIPEVELQALDTLNRHLRLHLPECVEKDPGSPLRILSNTYGKTISPEAKEKREELETRVQKAVNPFNLSDSSKGINKAQLITTSSSNVNVAVQKAEHEERMGRITAVMRGKPETEGPKYAAIGGVNELIAANLSTLLGGIFAIPLAMRKADTTIHAFAESEGSFKDNWLAAADKQAFLKSLPQRPTQGLIMGQLALGGLDCHGDNILLDTDNNPIAIDFGMSLGYDPLDVNANLCAVYLDWPAMDAPLTPEDLSYWENLDIDAAMSALQETIEAPGGGKTPDAEMQEVIQGHLRHLRARLITLQEGVRGDLISLRQLTALFLPPITKDEHFEMWHAAEKTDSPDYKKIANDHIKSKGFKRAWTEAQGDEALFKDVIQQEIEALSKESLYGEYERTWYSNANFDVSLQPLTEDS